MTHQTLQADNIYGNHIIQCPDGEFLCRAALKKINWYLDRNLAEIIKDGDQMIVRLIFEPASRSGSDDPFYASEKETICCVCGTKEGLTKHHCVPISYRKFFPTSIKKHNYHDVLLLCSNCHERYEKLAADFRLEVAKQYGYKSKKKPEDPNQRAAASKAHALLVYKDKMPQQAIDAAYAIVETYLGRHPTEEDIQELDGKSSSAKEKTVGQIIVERILAEDRIQEFVISWRQHFVDTMKPQYLPQHWRIDHPSGMNEEWK